MFSETFQGCTSGSKKSYILYSLRFNYNLPLPIFVIISKFGVLKIESIKNCWLPSVSQNLIVNALTFHWNIKFNIQKLYVIITVLLYPPTSHIRWCATAWHTRVTRQYVNNNLAVKFLLLIALSIHWCYSAS